MMRRNPTSELDRCIRNHNRRDAMITAVVVVAAVVVGYGAALLWGL